MGESERTDERARDHSQTAQDSGQRGPKSVDLVQPLGRVFDLVDIDQEGRDVSLRHLR